MDDDLRQAFATLSAQISDVGTDARNAASLARETAHETVKLSRRFDAVEADVSHLKSAVFGSKPPPTAPNVLPLQKRITHSEGELAELCGQVISVKAINQDQSKDIGDLKVMVNTNTAETMALRAALTQNTRSTMAIEKVVVDGVASFWKRNPKLETAFAGLVLAAIAFVTHWLVGGR